MYKICGFVKNTVIDCSFLLTLNRPEWDAIALAAMRESQCGIEQSRSAREDVTFNEIMIISI